MIVRAARVMEGGPDRRALGACVQEFLAGEERRRRLRAYYDGESDVLSRRRAAGLPNNRLVHAFPRYISTVASGYLIGNPVSYEAEEGQRAALDAVLECYDRCAADSVDVELASHASIFGRGVELVFADAEAKPRTVALDPRRAFVVYDDSAEHRPLFGVRLCPVLSDLGAEEGWETEVWTKDEALTFSCRGLGEIGALKERRAHFFGEVPMTEYWNDADERGDFEGVLTLIDAYDALESDRVNDKEQFVDALLLLSGCTLESDERGRTPGQQLREDKVLVLPDADARAEWLCKQLSETDAEVLKRALETDIHKLSMVPDLSDEHFAGVTSGVAMRYKLLGLEQLTRVKERWFREALRCRLRLFSEFLAVRGAPRLEAAKVRMAFTRTLPVNELEQAQAIGALKGVLDDEALARRAERISGEF